MKRWICFLLLVILASGCATGYQKRNWLGGYYETKIQDDVFRIRFFGNAYCHLDKAEDYALLRCSEVVIENGFKYFIIVENKSESQAEVYSAPAVNSTSPKIKTSYKSSATVTIKCFKEKPGGASVIIYDAGQVKYNLKKQYHLN